MEKSENHVDKRKIALYLKNCLTDKGYFNIMEAMLFRKRRCLFMVTTFRPHKKQRSKVHGFRARMSTAGGRKVLASRRAKGRKQLSA